MDTGFDLDAADAAAGVDPAALRFRQWQHGRRLLAEIEQIRAAESELAARRFRLVAELARDYPAPIEFANDIAPALHITDIEAYQLLERAAAFTTVLPETLAALAAGRIGRRRPSAARDDTNTNQVFSGLSGMIIVRDPNEAALQASGTLPPPDQTKPIVLSDTTVCKAPGTNDPVTYPNPGDNTLPWFGNPGGGATPALPVQANPTPKMLCETPTAVDGAGNLRTTSYAAGDIPSIQQTVGGRENEGQTVLTNGKNVGGRAGSPAAPGALAPGASTLDVRPGQGLRLELVNTSAIRYFRLRISRTQLERHPADPRRRRGRSTGQRGRGGRHPGDVGHRI